MKAATALKIGGVLAALGLSFLALKKAPEIGQFLGDTVGGGLAGGFKSLSDSFLGAFDILNPLKSSAEQIVNTANLGSNVINVPSPTEQSFSSSVDNMKTNELLALGGLLQKLGSPVKVDVSNRSLTVKDKFVQPLDFAFNDAGVLQTGTVGVKGILDKQAFLSKQFGIVTFDMKGNISTVGGLVSSL